jgi:5-(carboxyamino)imidazole ribonucleotide synthase
VIAPGAVIGMLGGGQLGRMTALAARAMGYRVHVLDPDANCATSPVADRTLAARFDDATAATELARHCDVVTLEIEQISTAVLEAAAALAPTRPGARVIAVVQDRAAQKQWLERNGFPLGAYRIVEGPDQIAAAVATFGECYVKSCRGGYDGRGQARISDASAAAAAWRAVGEQRAVAERALALAAELSVMVARRPNGEVRVFPVALNHHERQALSWSMTPAPLPKTLLQQATDIGRGIAEQLEIEGLIAAELFLTVSGDLYVNELAPRPHNSFHATERACVTSQFEQLTRAVCDLPLGDTGIVRPAAIVNLFGDIWREGALPAVATALSDPLVRLHLYGKPGPRPGRKMGHLSSVGGSALDALESARAAAARIGAMTEDVPASVRELIA